MSDKKNLKRGKALLGLELSQVINNDNNIVEEVQDEDDEEEMEISDEINDNKSASSGDERSNYESCTLGQYFDKSKIPPELRISLCRSYANLLAVEGKLLGQSTAGLKKKQKIKK